MLFSSSKLCADFCEALGCRQHDVSDIPRGVTLPSLTRDLCICVLGFLFSFFLVCGLAPKESKIPKLKYVAEITFSRAIS